MTDYLPKPWERQPKEPERAFNGFKTFLYMQSPRTYQKTADELGVGIDHIKAWGAKYSWQRRAQQYDAFMGGKADDARVSAIKVFQSQVVTEEVEDYQKLRAAWQDYFDNLVKNMENIDADDFLDRMKKLTAIRTMIDQMARKAASLPNTYRAAEMPAEVQGADDTPMMLTMDGPRLLGDNKDDGRGDG